MTKKNYIQQGDCLDELKNIKENSIDLIYLDPPFFTQKQQSLKTRDNSKQFTFNDTWNTIEDYSDYITKRLEVCKRVLKKTGSIFLHCDRSASHHLRLALDKVFGSSSFQSEIIWAYRRWSNSKKGLLNAHQVIFFYSKTNQFKFNPIYTEYSETTNVDQIFQERIRDEHGKSLYKTQDDGSYVLRGNKKGVPLSDVWEIPYLNPKARERVGYPTQKPILLIEQIIKLVTDEEDIVLDPFCGSGTTLVAAKLLSRQYIGFDISEEAICLTNKRLNNPIKTESNLLKNGRDSYKNQDPAIVEKLLQIGAQVVQRNKGIDGFLKVGKVVEPVPIRIQREKENFEEARSALLKACRVNQYPQQILVRNSKATKIPSLFAESNENFNGLIIVDDLSLAASVLTTT